MVSSATGQQPSAGDWDVYWRGTRENAAHQEGGPQEAVLESFWLDFFSRHTVNDMTRMLDIAAGNGAVTGYALRANLSGPPCCLDYSVNAMVQLHKRYPQALCVAADAANAPFGDGAFDLVCSQFGLEYAGADSIDEAARLVAPGGTLALILHLHGGAIYRECELNLRAIDAIRDSGIMALARTAFDAGFALNAGTGEVAAFKAAERRFTPAVRALEDIMRSMGRDVAAGLAQQLYQDIATMYRQMSAYEHSDIVAWIDGMTMELDAYAGRMASMLAAALDEEAIGRMTALVEQRQMRPLLRETLTMGGDTLAAAWALIWQRAD